MKKNLAYAALIVVATSLNFSRTTAQEVYSQEASPSFQQTDYEALTRRLDKLEAKQRMSGATCQSNWYGLYESVLVTPVFSHNSAYYGQSGTNLTGDASAVNVPFDYSMDYSPRIEAGYLAPTNELGWRARYWHFNSNGRAGNHVDVFGTNPVDDAIAMSAGARIEDIDTFASGFVLHSMNVDVGDLEVTKQYRGMVFGAGMRISEIRQRYQLLGVTDAGQLLDSQMRNIGIGPTVSLQWNHSLLQSRWSLFSDVRGSALFGRHDIDAVSDDDLGLFQYSANKSILGAEIQAGLQYTGNRFFTRVGVEAQHWGNVGNAMNTISHGEDGEGDNGILFDGNLGFIGLSWGIGYQF